MIKKNFWRFTLTFIGIIFIFYSLFLITLGLIGEDKSGTLITYRRILGERGEVIPNQYTYSLEYKFYVDKNEYSGTSTVIGSPLFMKPDGQNLIEIVYLKEAPYLNALKSDTRLDIGKFVMIIVGTFLVYIINLKNK